MMTNLFSVFDPTTGMMSCNWISMLTLIVLPSMYWYTSSNLTIMIKSINMKIHLEMFSLMKTKGISVMLNSLFLMIILSNIMGMFPYVFTASSHLTFSLPLSLTIWMSLMMFGWKTKYKMMFIHLVPIGTPTMLMPVMVIIETISNLIRPGSLAIRLSANMIAGHLLMSLMGDAMSDSNIVMSMMISMSMILMMFELSVAIIQSYVFMTLSTLYYSEI